MVAVDAGGTKVLGDSRWRGDMERHASGPGIAERFTA